MKHRLKLLLRRALALALHATGLRALFRRARGGVPVLMFHNVGDPEAIAYLPGHMKISERKLVRLLRLLKRGGYETITIRDMIAALERGEVPPRAVALTFDDGYRDNLDVLLPILRERGAVATVYVQTGPSKGRLNWLHHYFWSLHRLGPHGLAEEIAQRVDRKSLQKDFRSLPPGETAGEYEMKRLLKYEVTHEDRDRILKDVFASLGGDEAELAKAVYLGPGGCRELDNAGVEIGAHTVNHLVLSTLEASRQRKEIEGSLRDLESWLGHPVATFAYPYGRAWDYNRETVAILEELGFSGALTAMPGVNDTETPRFELKRFGVSQRTSVAEIMCEVDGVFACLGRKGLSLQV